VRPGDEFQVYAGGTALMVRCPPGSMPGSRIMVMAPRQPRTQQVYMVTVPQGVAPGQRFAVMVNNERMSVVCPPNVRPGMQIRITLPNSPNRPGQGADNGLTQTFEVTVPTGVNPGQPFALIANGQRVMVNCPPDARPGQKIRFQLPLQLNAEQLQSFKLSYNKDGWVRCVGPDLKFHWVNTKSQDSSDPRTRSGSESSMVRLNLRRQVSSFDPSASAFVRKLEKTDDDRVFLTLLKAQEAVMEASVPEVHVTFQDLTRVNQQSFDEKSAWFKQQCSVLRLPWDIEHQHIKIRRTNLLEDSMRAFRSLTVEKSRQIFRFEFIGEPGIDAGGVAREWYHLVSEQLFNPDFALFQFSSVDQMCLQINPNSVIIEDHLDYFFFAGQVLGKALFDGQLVQSHVVRPIYKHMLAWPLLFSDFEQVDHQAYSGLCKMLELDDVSVCCVDFSVTEERLGTTQELELLLCGLPTIDIEDWKQNTEYVGDYERKKASHHVVQWFWSVVEYDFTTEQQARLLQFVTGTSGVPAQGFSVLQGNDGSIRKFTINSLSLEAGIYPRAHTCFNRIDLPLYKCKEDLKNNLSLAVQLEATGFDID